MDINEQGWKSYSEKLTAYCCNMLLFTNWNEQILPFEYRLWAKHERPLTSCVGKLPRNPYRTRFIPYGQVIQNLQFYVLTALFFDHCWILIVQNRGLWHSLLVSAAGIQQWMNTIILYVSQQFLCCTQLTDDVYGLLLLAHLFHMEKTTTEQRSKGYTSLQWTLGKGSYNINPS